MMKRGWCVGALLVLLAYASQAQVGTWKNYTSMKDVRGVARQGSTAWAATSGGLFSWSAAGDVFRLFTNADGLLSTDLTAVGIDPTGLIWVGTSTGILHVYDPSTATLRTILDIASANQTTKGINAFFFQGDTVLICTQFGLSVFKISTFGFGDTFTKFGAASSGARYSVLSAVIFENKIWACLTDGLLFNSVAVGDLRLPNLLPPENWALTTVGSPGSVPGSLATLAGTLYAGASSGLFKYSTSVWAPVSPPDPEPIIALAPSASALAIITASRVYLLDTQGNALPYGATLPSSPRCAVMDASGAPIVGSSGSGLLTFETGWTSHMPNGPNANQMSGVAIDAEGIVWCASGSSGGSGFSRLRDGQWKSFTTPGSPLLNNDFHRSSVTPDGAAWLSSFGRGLVEIPSGQDSVASSGVFWTNVGMVGLPNDREYVVPSNVVGDRQGNRWTTIINSADREVVSVRTPSGSWLHLPADINGVRVSTLTDTPVDLTLAVDETDNLWSVVRDPTFRGVVNFRNRGTTDLSRTLLVAASDGLPSDDIRTIVVDRENDIWVGTDKGIGIILDPANPKRDGGIAKYKPLLGQVVNTIAVDPLNRKWVGTNQGAILLSADGTQLLASYTVENTQGKIISNTITSIGIDRKTGAVYFGTPQGLASLTTSAAAPVESFADLEVYPNPFRLPATGTLTVDGLMENSSLKVLTSDGRLIRTIKSPGGRVGFWDGRDEEGNEVASGVYLIVAYTDDGQVARGKVAVVRQR
jgi:sugar lactone lactonase YvrE